MKTFPTDPPPEILTQIFEWLYIISIGKPDLADGRHVRQLCWPVSQVCRFWREVALAAPFLWTYLPTLILDQRQVSPSPDKQLERLKVLIPRTRNRALHISTDGPIYNDFEWWMDVIDYIAQFCDRWETVKLDLREGGQAGPTLFKHVANLDLQPAHGFSQLTTLKIREEYDRYGHDDATDKILFPALKSLDYAALNDLRLQDGFLEFAKTPVLEELFVFASAGSFLDCLSDLKSRSESLPLKSLHVDTGTWGSTWNEDALPGVLRLFPDLESLVINLPSISNIEHLTISRGDDILVPNLRRCTFVVCQLTYDVDFNDYRVIAEMAEGRASQPQLSGLNPDAPEFPTDNDDNIQFYMQLSLIAAGTTHGEKLQGPAGIRDHEYSRPDLYPVQCESWYEPGANNSDDTDSEDQEPCRGPRSLQTRTAASLHTILYGIPQWMLSVPQIADTVKYPKSKSLLNLVARLENEYRSENLVDFLLYNTSISLLYLANEIKKCLSQETYEDNEMRPAYYQVIRILKRVKSDLLQEIGHFHWVWELHHDFQILHYIHDHHEIRDDPDRFANAILGLADDLWIFEDL